MVTEKGVRSSHIYDSAFDQERRVNIRHRLMMDILPIIRSPVRSIPWTMSVIANEAERRWNAYCKRDIVVHFRIGKI